MSGARIRFSFVIPARASSARIAGTLESIASLTFDPAEVETIVVFDGGQWNLEAAAPPACTKMRVTLLEQEPAGPAAARNRGADRAEGEWLVFLDDDCRLHPDFLMRLDGALGDARTALGGTPQIPGTAPLWSHASHLVVEAFTASQNRVEDVRFLPSQCLTVNRSRWLHSEGFDERFRSAAGEDRDFCRRWIRQGGRLARVAGATYVHDHPLTLASFLRKHREYGAAARFAGAAMRSPGRFALAAIRSLAEVRPLRRAALLGVAVFVSQIAAVWGALLARHTEEPVRCAQGHESA